MVGLEKYQWLNSCAGVELHMLPDGVISARLCNISLQKDTLSIDSKLEVTGELTEVLKKVPVAKPVSLSLTGKGVLTRKTAKEEDLTEDKLLRLYPNINPAQFYFQNFINGDQSYISIIRKEVVDGILKVFDKAGVPVLLINLGPFAAAHILKQINNYGNDIHFDGHNIRLSDEEYWEDYKYSASSKAGFTTKIGIEPIAEQYLLAYAAAFQLALCHKLDPVLLPVEPVQNAFSNFEQKHKFNFRLAVVLGVFFVLLLVNFLLFSYYSSKNNVLMAQVSQSTASTKTIQETESDINRNIKLLEAIGWYKGISHAWLADQLGQSLPAGISLKEIHINPLDASESNRRRREVYKTGIIEVAGESAALEPVNEWIYQLKSKSWQQEVKLDSFSPSTENDRQNFNLTIKF